MIENKQARNNQSKSKLQYFYFITRTHYPNNVRKGMPPRLRSLIAGLMIVSQDLQSLI